MFARRCAAWMIVFRISDAGSPTMVISGGITNAINSPIDPLNIPIGIKGATRILASGEISGI